MEKYKVTLCLTNIDAKNEEDAKRKFWIFAIEDKEYLELIVEKMRMT